MRALSTLLSVACLSAGSCTTPTPGEEIMLDIEPLDESRLDRSEDIGECGYPGPGAEGYGIEVGQRLENWGSFVDCEGNQVAFSDFFCKRNDAYGDYNRAILVSIGAGWCEPCKEETAELMPEVYEPLHEQGLEIVQVLFQDEDGQFPPSSFCRTWKDELYDPPLAFPVLLDQTQDWSSDWLLDPQSATPVSMLIDANGNIRWKVEGQNPPDTYEQSLIVLNEPYGD